MHLGEIWITRSTMVFLWLDFFQLFNYSKVYTYKNPACDLRKEKNLQKLF